MKIPGEHQADSAIILFDGECNLCNNSVKFIIERDPNKVFRFASMQSEAGRRLLREYGLEENSGTMVLLENGQVFVRSSAALRIAGKLKGVWPLLYPLLIVPSGVRDAAYNTVAKNRYRFFGKSASCMVPDREIAERFLK